MQKATVAYGIYTADNFPWTEMNHETTGPPNHPSLSLSQDVENITSWHAAAFSRAHHTPGLGALGTNLVQTQIDVCDGRVYLQRLGQGLEAATDQGWHLVRGPFGQNLISEMLKQKDIQLRHVESLWFKTRKNNSEIHTFIQHLYIWRQLNSIRDERRNYSTLKPSKLLSVKGCRGRDIMTCPSIQQSPPHTRPWHPHRQSGCHTKWSPWRTCWF